MVRSSRLSTSIQGTWQIDNEDGAYRRDTTNVTRGIPLLSVLMGEIPLQQTHSVSLAPRQTIIRYDVYLDKVPAINTSYKNNAKMTATEIWEQK